MGPKKASNRANSSCTFLSIAAATAVLTFVAVLLIHRSTAPASTAPAPAAATAAVTVLQPSQGAALLKGGAAVQPPPSASLQPIHPKSKPPPRPSPAAAALENTSKPSKPLSSTFPAVSDLIQCPAAVHAAYSSLGAEAASKVQAERSWCDSAKAAHRVIVGRSWGTLNKHDQKLWEDHHCNEHMAIGTVLPCEQKWGWTWLQSWHSNQRTVSGNSSCMVDQIRTATYCELSEVMLDFSKAKVQGLSRGFESGFLTIHGDINHAALPLYPGIRNPKTAFNRDACDRYEDSTAFLLSNDDIFNLGHYINDVMMVWAQMAMTADRGQGKMLVNMDGLRAGGPAGGPAHRLMLANAPDTHGPYSAAYYHSWFNGKVVKALDYQKQKVCFRKLITFPLPGVPWFWNDWGRINDCSLIAASPLYQSFNYYLRKQVSGNRALLKTDLAPPPVDKIHIVIEVREINKAKRNNHSSARHIRNLKEVIAGLQTIPNVMVTAQNFAALDFVQQIQLAHSASIILSMHGAGTTHIFHMALGAKNCCGLLELFPDESVDFYTAQGYGNLARMLGLHTVRYVPPRGSTQSAGTTLEVEKIVALTKQLVDKVSLQPTCMHDVKDLSG